MRNFYKGLILATGLATLVGCQSNNNGLFMAQPTDASITNTINDSIVHDQNLARTKIHVQTMNGNVMLTGRVKTIRQSDTASAIAKNTAGVRAVENHLVVRK